jgi:hypothetical protein
VVDVVGNQLAHGALHHHPALCTWGAGAAHGVCGTVVPILLYVGFPVAVALAILRHRLYGIERLVQRSVVLAFLSVLIALAYVGAAASGIAAGRRLPLWAAVLGTIAATTPRASTPRCSPGSGRGAGDPGGPRRRPRHRDRPGRTGRGAAG